LFNLTLTLSISLLFNVIILRFGRLLNKSFIFKILCQNSILEIDGKRYEFPVVEGSENEQAIDIKKLRDLTGIITLDPGIFRFLYQ
jgi:hypothetical protein